jgi:hypothetical protein
MQVYIYLQPLKIQLETYRGDDWFVLVSNFGYQSELILDYPYSLHGLFAVLGPIIAINNTHILIVKYKTDL